MVGAIVTDKLIESAKALSKELDNMCGVTDPNCPILAVIARLEAAEKVCRRVLGDFDTGSEEWEEYEAWRKLSGY